MRLLEIEKRARDKGINDTWKYNKKQLIKLIQNNEGNNQCFATKKGFCEQFTCCWKEDCLK